MTAEMSWKKSGQVSKKGQALKWPQFYIAVHATYSLQSGRIILHLCSMMMHEHSETEGCYGRLCGQEHIVLCVCAMEIITTLVFPKEWQWWFMYTYMYVLGMHWPSGLECQASKVMYQGEAVWIPWAAASFLKPQVTVLFF